MSSKFDSNIIPIAAAVVIIVFAIAITSAVQDSPGKSMSQIITVGPVWKSDGWVCTSDGDFIVHATLRGTGEKPQIQIKVQGKGSQSYYNLATGGEVEPFTVGSVADKKVTIIKTGSVTGFLTLQTTSNAQASCIDYFVS